MTTRDRFDIDGYEDVEETENYPHHIVNPDAWRARPSAGARLYLWGVVVLAVIVWSVVFYTAFQGGWR